MEHKLNWPLILVTSFKLTAGAAQADTGRPVFGSGPDQDPGFPVRLAEPVGHSPLLQPVPLKTSAARTSDIVIQIGAFAHYANAARRAERLSGYGPTRIVESVAQGRRLYRVFLGEFQMRDEARELLRQIRSAGHDGFLSSPE